MAMKADETETKGSQKPGMNHTMSQSSLAAAGEEDLSTQFELQL
jgi:hypothetical protein